MEYIKVSKVDNVILHKRGYVIHGSLHLTTHHLIFTVANPKPKELKEIWICYPIISSVERRSGSAYLTLLDSISSLDGGAGGGESIDEIQLNLSKYLPKLHNVKGEELNLFKLTTIKLNCKDFNYLSFDFENEHESADVFQSIMKLTCLQDLTQLYAFIYQPNPIEAKFNAWQIYHPLREFQRQGLNFQESQSIGSSTNWRVTNLNLNYKLCETYPKVLVIPKTISDNVLTHASKYRSKQRIPALSYYYSKNGCTITRCSQPLLGIQKSRSVQDEKLIDEIFKASDTSTRKNLIIDARPTTNAMAQTALGAGSENMDYYHGCEKAYLGIDNIHVMRDSLEKLTCLLQSNDLNRLKLDRLQLTKTNWLKNISLLLNSSEKLIKSLVLNNANLLIHCSDGWDRTSQVSSLIQLCIDPYFRTIEGFIILIEKEWLSFGHRFNERSGHLNSESQFNDEILNNSATFNNSFQKFGNHFKKRKHLKFTSPIFHQFIDGVYQIILQHPTKFQFNERFLRRLLYHLYSCQYGNFLVDSEYQRHISQISLKTRSVWDYFLSRRFEFMNPEYNTEDINLKGEDFISPDFKKVRWWWQLYGKSDEEMNGKPGKEKDGELERNSTNNEVELKQTKNEDENDGDDDDDDDDDDDTEELQEDNIKEQTKQEDQGIPLQSQSPTPNPLDTPTNTTVLPRQRDQLFGLSSMTRDSQVNLSYEHNEESYNDSIEENGKIDTNNILKELNDAKGNVNGNANGNGYVEKLLAESAGINRAFQRLDIE